MALARSTGNAVKFVTPINGSDYRVAKRRKRGGMKTRPLGLGSGKRKTYFKKRG